jgi:hypothetical protein
MDRSAIMRTMLAGVGIFLDDKSASEPEPPADEPDWDAIAIDVDRALIRRILVERGAPGCDLDWLTSSCPSLEAAQLFEPTPWMLRDFGDYLTGGPTR